MLAAAAAIALAARFWFQDPDTRPWNLVLVSIDTLRADQLSVYGGSVQVSALDRLAPATRNGGSPVFVAGFRSAMSPGHGAVVSPFQCHYI